MINHIFMPFSAVQIDTNFHLLTCILRLLGYGNTKNSQRGQFLVGLIAELVERLPGIAEVMGSDPVQALATA